VRRLVVCADDFGQSEPIDAGILSLARAGRLGAVSCLPLGPALARDLPALLATGVDAGLHLDLTEGLGGSPAAPLGGVILRAYFGALDGAALAAQVIAQLDAFLRLAGRPPAFVDGHRHVHQLPQVRSALLAELTRRWPGRVPPIRVTVPRRARGPKAALIAALGGRALRRALDARAIPHNADFAGVYGFEPTAPYRALVQGWLASLEDGGLLMCHPGEAGDDPIGAARVRELAYLGSPEFEADCTAAGVARIGFSALGATGAAPRAPGGAIG
jgi:chitin disaccharide deacetylase